MVRQFKGVVKVADVQAEFDSLLNSINEAIDNYNSSLNIEDIDYNNGGSELAPLGYTLSVGGLKAILDAYDGALLGGQLLRINAGNYIVSEGLYIKDREVYRLPSKAVAGDGNILYFDKDNELYSFSNKSSETGYYQDIETTTTTPDINGSDSSALGTLDDGGTGRYATEYYQGIAVKDAPYYPYMCFPNNSPRWFYSAVRSNNVDYSLRWTFLNPTELQSISLQYGAFGGGTLTITDLNGNVLLADGVSGVGTNAQKAYVGYFNTGATKYNGIAINLHTSNTNGVAALQGVLLGNIKLIGKTITRVYIPTGQGNPEDFIPICSVNSNRISRLCNTQNAVNESIPNYIVKTQSKAPNIAAGAEPINNSTHGQFVSAFAGVNNGSELFGHSVTFHTQQNHNDRQDSYWEPLNFLFIPKGIANPYNRNPKQRVWDYILTRPEIES